MGNEDRSQYSTDLKKNSRLQSSIKNHSEQFCEIYKKTTAKFYHSNCVEYLQTSTFVVFKKVLHFNRFYFRSANVLSYKIWKKKMVSLHTDNAQNIKFSIKDFFSKCHQTRRKQQISSPLLKKYLMENLFFLCSVTFICLTDTSGFKQQRMWHPLH